MEKHGAAPYNLGQYNQVLVAMELALPKALQDTDPKDLIPLLQKNGERIEEGLGQLFHLLKESTSPVVAMPASGVKPTLLEEIGTVSIPETTGRFLVRERFVLNYGHKVKPGKRISYLGDNFKEWFLDKTEEPMPESMLRYAKLLCSELDGPIMDELGDAKETKLAEIYALMQLQPNGEEGVLLTNGWANIFYVRDINGGLRAVDVYWHGDGWRVDADSVTHPVRWYGEDRVFSRNS